MRIGRKELRELTEPVADEGDPRLLFPPVKVFPRGLALPRVWRELLGCEDAHERMSGVLWKDTARVLPRAVQAIEKRLQAVGLLTTKKRRPSLLYVFREEGDLEAYRGNPPRAKLPPVSKGLSINLSPVYAVHDGWTDLWGTDWLLPSGEWEILATDKTAGFLKVFNRGGNAMGFDLSEHPAGSYAIYSDGEVGPIRFWKEVDSWIADELNDMDRR